MNLQDLFDNPPWDWPENAAEILIAALADGSGDPEDRLGAVELAGELSVINDELARALLTILRSAAEVEELRASAAISLGPALEYMDDEVIAGLGELNELGALDDLPLSEQSARQIQEVLHTCYLDTDLPSLVRRRCLEASVRAPQEWHPEALRAALAHDDQPWRLTAVFTMSWIKGFETQILESLQSEDEEFQAQALYAASRWEIDGAWPTVAALVSSKDTPKDLLLAAIDAAATIRPSEARDLLDELTSSDDEDIVDAAEEAISMAEDLQQFTNEEVDESVIVH